VPGFETGVRIRRPIEAVFAYVADPLNLRHWNSAVRAVRPANGRPGERDSTYVMERELPTGRAVNGLTVFALERPIEIGIRTTSGPTPFSYRYRLSYEDGGTVVRVAAEFGLGGAAALLGPVPAPAVRRGADDNLATLKRVLEDPARVERR
jgi:hypothetical protein